MAINSTKKIILGIIGCGHWGPNFVRNFSSIAGINVKIACDLDNQKLQHIQGLYPDIILTNNYKKIINDPCIDAVIVATPAKTHYKLAKECLLNNKHVLVEKPITLHTKEARELIEISKKNKKILMVGHTFKFNPAVLKLRKLISKGSLGQVYYIYSRRTNLGPLRKDVNAIWDLTPHDISIVNYLLGDMPQCVRAQGEKYLAHNLEDVSFITLKYPDKVLVHLHVSWLDPKKTREIVIVGSKKMAVFDDLNAENPISIYDKGVMKKKFKQDYNTFEEFQMIVRSGKTIYPKIKKQEPLKEECRHFIKCIRNNKTPLTDGKDGLDVLKVLIAIEKSLLKNGDKITISP